VRVHTPAAPAPEVFRYLSTDTRSPGYWATAVTSAAVSLAAADPLGTPDASGDDRPVAGSHTTGGGTDDNYTTSWQSLVTTPGQYLDPLARLHDTSLVAVPGGTDPTVQQALIAHCERLQDRFAVLDSAPAVDLTGVTNQFANVRSPKGYAALYYPWITVRNPSTGALETWPPSGHILGVYARTDAERGVHKAPANTNIRGALGLMAVLSDQEQGPLNLMGVNVLRVFPGQSQPIVWGARTTAGDLDRNWQYVDVRRLFIYLEQSIEVGIRWAVFEPNDLSLWQKLKRSVGDFLTQTWRDGALFGAKPEDAFYVRIDEALNPASTRALGRLYIEVGVAPTYPAEFIVLRIGIWNGGAEVTTS
jgi:phage tail sheath protein FI